MSCEQRYLQFSAHGGPLQSFFIAGRTISRQALLARRFVPNQKHLADRCLVPRPAHGALHCRPIQKIQNNCRLTPTIKINQ